MNKKKSFALSWGRKMFFGQGWILTSVVALSYLQSLIIPQSFEAWSFLLLNYIGQYGLLLSGVYFLIYCPVILLFPSYYISRIWSIFLILLLNVLIFIDSYIFTQYRFHLNSFMFKLLKNPEILLKTDFAPIKLGVMVLITFVMIVFFWLRGEKLWRLMQGRFSNPVRNWYMVFIVLCFISGQALQFKSESNGLKAISKIAELFPLKISLVKGGNLSQNSRLEPRGYKDFYYPEKINCSSKKNKNVVLITFNNWSYEDLTEELMPNINHYMGHGISFKNHFSGGDNSEDGFFSLLYSMPPNYSSSVKNQMVLPLFMTELTKAKFDFSFYKKGAESALVKLLPREKEIDSDYIESNLVAPFFMQVFLSAGNMTFKDDQVKVILESLLKSNMINETIVIITGAYSETGKTPLLVLWPGRPALQITKTTSHYDILPTIMQEDWKCKTSMDKFSFGMNLFSNDQRHSLIKGNYEHLELLNLKNEKRVVIEPNYRLTVKELGAQKEVTRNDSEFILASLKKMAKFYRR